MFPGYVFWFGIDPHNGLYDVVAMQVDAPERALAVIERKPWDVLH